jgi:hypothetical protein
MPLTPEIRQGIDRDNRLESRATDRPHTSILQGDWQLRNPLNAPAKGV